MKEKSFSELCKELNVKRSTLQGWVENILGRKPVPKSTAPLLFNEEECQMLWQIRFYKQIKHSDSSLTNNEIVRLINNPDDIETRLDYQISEMKKQRDQLDLLIKAAEYMKLSRTNVNTIKLNPANLVELSYNEIVAIMANSIVDAEGLINEDVIDEIFSEDKLSTIINVSVEIAIAEQENIAVSSELIQDKVASLFNIISNGKSKSIQEFNWFLGYFSPAGLIGSAIRKQAGEKAASYLSEAISYYCKTHMHNSKDILAYNAIETLIGLAGKQVPADSQAVQLEIQNMYNYFKSFDIFTEKGVSYMLYKFADLYQTGVFESNLPKAFPGLLTEGLNIFFKKVS